MSGLDRRAESTFRAVHVGASDNQSPHNIHVPALRRPYQRCQVFGQLVHVGTMSKKQPDDKLVAKDRGNAERVDVRGPWTILRLPQLPKRPRLVTQTEQHGPCKVVRPELLVVRGRVDCPL